MNKRETGKKFEETAAGYLESKGVMILEKNYRIPAGEIDLIGMDGEYLVFFEVKYRSSLKMGDPLSAVDFRKRQKIMNVSKHYLYEHHYRENAPVRFDCIGITGDKINWIRNSFTA